jgi:purine-binding chemotaxis protein CheW
MSEHNMSSSAFTPSRASQRRADAAGTMQVVSFRLASEEYGIEITKVQEIILMGDITRVPHAAVYIKGLINLRSMVIPIVDLRVRFDMPEVTATDETRIMVINFSGKTIGIIVDAVNEVLRISKEQIAPPPLTALCVGQDYLTGLAKLGKRLLILLDVDRILGELQPSVQNEEATVAAN